MYEFDMFQNVLENKAKLALFRQIKIFVPNFNQNGVHSKTKLKRCDKNSSYVETQPRYVDNQKKIKKNKKKWKVKDMEVINPTSISIALTSWVYSLLSKGTPNWALDKAYPCWS